MILKLHRPSTISNWIENLDKILEYQCSVLIAHSLKLPHWFYINISQLPKVWILQKPMSGEERPSLCTNAFFSFVNKLPCNFLWKFKAPILFYLHVKLTVVVPMYLRRGRCWYFKPSHSSYRYLLWVSFMSSILAWDAYDFIFLSQKLRQTFTKLW